MEEMYDLFAQQNPHHHCWGWSMICQDQEQENVDFFFNVAETQFDNWETIDLFCSQNFWPHQKWEKAHRDLNVKKFDLSVCTWCAKHFSWCGCLRQSGWEWDQDFLDGTCMLQKMANHSLHWNSFCPFDKWLATICKMCEQPASCEANSHTSLFSPQCSVPCDRATSDWTQCGSSPVWRSSPTAIQVRLNSQNSRIGLSVCQSFANPTMVLQYLSDKTEAP